MSLIDHALKANEQFVRRYDPKLGGRPHPKIAIVTCMDPRLSDLEGILGLKTADMDVIRTGGPAVTDDVLGELVVSTRVLGSKEIMLLNHTGCGFTTFTDNEAERQVRRQKRLAVRPKTCGNPQTRVAAFVAAAECLRGQSAINVQWRGAAGPQ